MRFNFWTRWTSFHSQLKWKSYGCDIRVSTRASEMRVVNCGQHMWWLCYLTVLSIQMACKGPKNVWLIESNEVWPTGKWTTHQIVRSGIYKMIGQPIWLPKTNLKDWHTVASLLPPTVRRVVCPCLAAVLSAWHRYQPQLYCFRLECLYVFHHSKTWFWQTAIITCLYICGPILSSRQQHSHVRYRHKTEGRVWRCLPSHRSEHQHVDWRCSQCDSHHKKVSSWGRCDYHQCSCNMEFLAGSCCSVKKTICHFGQVKMAISLGNTCCLWQIAVKYVSILSCNY